MVSLITLGFAQTSSASWLRILDIDTPAEGNFRTDKDVGSAKLRVEKYGRDCKFTKVRYGVIANSYTVPLVPIGTTPTGGQVYNLYPAPVTITTIKFHTEQAGTECTYRFFVSVPDLN